MDWDGVLAMAAEAAPLLGKLLPIPGAGIAGELIASAFGVKNDKDEIAKAIGNDPQAYQKLKEIEMNNKAMLQAQVIEAETKRIAEINATMRAEAASTDSFVRRWRPMFGYIVGWTWGIQVVLITLAIVWVTVTDQINAKMVLDGISSIMGAMAVMWGIALSVLGVSVKQRSNDKALAAGQQPKGLISQITAMVK